MAVVLAAGGVVFAAAALTTERPWHERMSASLDGTTLRRTASRTTVGTELPGA